MNDGVTSIKPGHQTTGYGVLHAVIYIRKSLHLENAQGSLQSGMPGSNSETQGRFCVGLGSSILVFCWSHYYPSWLNYCKGVRGQVG
jgi:hypothetical protein